VWNNINNIKYYDNDMILMCENESNNDINNNNNEMK